MSSPQSARRPGAVVVVQSLLWLWLIGLSVFVALGYQTMNDQADQERLDSRLQRLEARSAGLVESIEAIKQRPAVATAADLNDTPQVLSARAAPVEKKQRGYAAAAAMAPPLVLWSLSPTASTLPAFANGSHYAIHVLAADPKALAERFATRGIYRWAGVAFAPGINGAPLL